MSIKETIETVNVDVILKNRRSLCDNTVINVCEYYLKTNKFCPGTVISSFNSTNNLVIGETVDHIIIGEHAGFSTYIDFSKVKIKWFLYTLDKNEQQAETELDDTGEAVQLASIRILPSAEYYNLWETLIYDIDIKENLINFASTSLLFADRGVDTNLITCNRVVLLHGPPGTGKTSLCKALAQKLTVRLQNRFKRGFLFEINSHSLFSKWFSESGKLVTKMFSRITEYLKDSHAIIFVLIDEIESLTHARENCMSGVEPSDSIRVVNAVLTQIDQIKNHPNVIILTTSNMTGAIDLAFVDRADIKQFIGLPGPEAIYQIYHSCIKELIRAEIIQPSVVLPSFSTFMQFQGCSDEVNDGTTLFKISERSIGLSGRTLRKIPFLAHSLFSQSVTMSIGQFFDAMLLAVEHQHDGKKHFVGKNK